jgi:hypothetical protein
MSKRNVRESVYMLLLLSLILLSIGFWLTLTGDSAVGVAKSRRNAQKVALKGPVIIGLGVLLGLLPLYEFIYLHKRKP